MKKINELLKVALSGFLLILTLSSPITTVNAAIEWDPVKWLMCDVFKDDNAKEIYKAATTEYIPYLLSSKSSLVSTDTKFNTNIFNKILSVSGYKISEKGQNGTNPFDKFGMAGLTFTSYRGEWKYFDVDPCASKEGSATDYGEFYEGRKDPFYTFKERSAAKDIRVKEHYEGDLKAYTKAVLDNIANSFLFVSKMIVTVTLAIIGLSLTDLSTLVGLGTEFQESTITKFYNGVFMPMVSLMFVFTGIYIVYHGIIKRKYREALVNGLGQSIISFVLAIIIGFNPQLVKIPNTIAVYGQAFILSTLTSNITGDGEVGLCPADFDTSRSSFNSSGNTEDNYKFLEKETTYMKSVIGCRMWSEYLFKPFVKGQFGTEYENLNELGNANKEWVKEPKVFLANGGEIINWGLFHVSTVSGNHTSVDKIDSPLINKVHKDWYRIVDALSNYDEIIIKGKPSTYGNTSGSGGDVNGEWTDPNSEAHKIAKEFFQAMVDAGASGKSAAAWTGAIAAETGGTFIEDMAESMTGAIIRFGMDNGTKIPSGAGPSAGDSNKNCTFHHSSTLGGPTTSEYCFGGGLMQTTPFLKFTESKFFGEAKGTKGWEAVNQINFFFDDEVWNRQMEGYMNGSNGAGIVNCGIPVSQSYNTMEELMEADDLQRAVAAWVCGYLRPSNQGLKLEYRTQLAEKANEMFNDKNIKADPSKWKFDSSSDGGGGGNSSSSSLTGGNTSGYPEPLDNPVLEQWDYWIGNKSGYRIGQAAIMVLFTIISSILPLVISLYAAAYGIGVTLLSIMAPIFLLLGCWGGKGNAVMKQWLGSLISTVLKRIASSLLLVISIILATNILSMINSVGYLKTLIFLSVVTFIFLKKRETILDTMSRINMGQLNLSHFKTGVKKVVKGATSAASLTTTLTTGGIAAKAAGGGFKSGVSHAFKNEIKNASQRTQFGRAARRAYDQTKSDLDKDESKTLRCINCQLIIEPGEPVYYDENNNIKCEECAALDGYENHTEVIFNNRNKNEYKLSKSNDKQSVTTVDTNGEIVEKEVEHFGFEDVNKAGLYKLNKDGWSEEERKQIQGMITDSVALLTADLKTAEETGGEISKAFIPEVLKSYINQGEIDKLIKNKNYDGYMDLIHKAYVSWYSTNYKNNHKNITDEIAKKEWEDNLESDIKLLNGNFNKIDENKQIIEEKVDTE